MHADHSKALDGCSTSEDWVRGLVADLKASWPGTGPVIGQKTPPAPVTSVLLNTQVARALRSDVKGIARDLSAIGDAEARRAALEGLVDQLERDWLNGEITLAQASNAYWSIGRALRQIAATKHVPLDGTAQTPVALVYVPLEELHVFGAEYLTDQLRETGVHVIPFFQRPVSDLLDTISRQRIDVVAASAGYDQSLLGLADVTASVRRRSCNPDIRVVVGGRVFDGPASSYDFIQADKVVMHREDPVSQIIAALPVVPSRRQPGHV
ncbi:MAG: cobalamin-dependent protein [Pseudomonadota bacterium]